MPYSDNPHRSLVRPPTGPPPLRGRPTGPPRGRPTGPLRYTGQPRPPPPAPVAPPPPSTETYENEPSASSSYATPRQFKYSTANLRSSGNLRKYGCICLMFLLFLGFGIGLSFLIDKLFFSEDASSADVPFAPSDNTTFPEAKGSVDASCSSAAFDNDGGAACQLLCDPVYGDCCNPFSETLLYEDGSTFPNNTDCSLDRDLRGCVSYSKCQASSSIYDPAPVALYQYCTMEQLARDPVSCQSLCQVASCCLGSPRNCLEDKLGMCLDYAPCQNLREGATLPVAPSDLDQLCFANDKQCQTFCDQAACCNTKSDSGGRSCLQENFIACLTYAPCSYSNDTDTDVTLAPQFSVVPKPPAEIVYACSDSDAAEGQYTTSCTELCTAMDCCMSTVDSEYCFDRDPLGCMAWYQQCQSLYTFGQ